MFEGNGASVKKRLTFEPFVDNVFGVSHHYDAETHKMLNKTYGDMLNSHNTTILSVTWIETLPTVNHTGRPFENLNMTNGRLLSLRDDGVIRTAVGQTTIMGHILESFNEFKGTNGSTNPLMLNKRQQAYGIDWLSFNTYGENMEEASDFIGDVGEVESVAFEGDSQASIASFDTAFVQAESGNYLTKFCLGASPNGDAVGQNSIIVGEVYQCMGGYRFGLRLWLGVSLHHSLQILTKFFRSLDWVWSCSVLLA